jgi:hypothetical protein
LKLEDTREIYYETTGKVSELVRQLGFAGIAVIWVFKTEAAGRQIIPRGFLPAGILIVLALAADLFQYAASVLIWDKFNRKKEIELTEKAELLKTQGITYDLEEADFDAPDSINDLTKRLFWTKFVLMFSAYLYLVVYLTYRVF